MLKCTTPRNFWWLYTIKGLHTKVSLHKKKSLLLGIFVYIFKYNYFLVKRWNTTIERDMCNNQHQVLLVAFDIECIYAYYSNTTSVLQIKVCIWTKFVLCGLELFEVYYTITHNLNILNVWEINAECCRTSTQTICTLSMLWIF